MSFNYFLAAILDEETKREIRQFGLDPSDPLLQHSTAPYNMHITVGYIGPIPDDTLEKVSDCFKPLEAFPAFPISISGIDFFGGGSNFKRYIGLTISDADQNLKKLNEQGRTLLQSATKLTFRGHHDFHPHITIQLLKHQLKSHDQHQLREHTKHLLKKPHPFWIKKLGLWYRNPKTQRYESHFDYTLQLDRF